MRKTGSYEFIGNTEHFIPDNLPPKPMLDWDTQMTELYGEAMLQLGKLNEMTNKLPDMQRFIKAYVIKEALLTSSIEGIHTTLLEVFTQPLLESKPNKDTQLVMNYTKALNAAITMIKNDGLPISTRVILNAHKVLMHLGEGDKADPGNYRKQSVRVGKFIPPQATKVTQLMSDLEHYINYDETFGLIKAGLAHVQFETIHPFLDGNGRIGRLLIVLILMENNLLSEPILYPSYYFKRNQLEYYQKLDGVRLTGDFEGWIKFYLTAIRDSSIDAYERARQIEELQKQLTELISNNAKSIKTKETQLNSLSILFGYPVISINELGLQLGASYNTAANVISEFLQLNIVVEENQQKRGKLFKFKRYLDVLEKEY